MKPETMLAAAARCRPHWIARIQELAQTLNHCVLSDNNESGLTMGWHGHRKHMLACFGTKMIDLLLEFIII